MELIDRAVAVMEGFANKERAERSIALRDLARLAIEIRANCDDPHGRGADWLGRSKEYREAISQIWSLTNASASVRSQFRYHTNAALRERVSPEVLEEYGLILPSVGERSAIIIRNERAELKRLRELSQNKA